MSGAGSAIGITADIRLNRAELVSDIAAARQTIQTEFSSMQINFGASLLESVRSVAPEITATIAQAVSAGMAGGGVPGGFPGIPGGGGGGVPGESGSARRISATLGKTMFTNDSGERSSLPP